MFADRRWSLSLSVLLSFAACKGGDPIGDFCDQQASCSCSAPPYATAEDCVSSLNGQVDQLKSFAMTKGLTFDQGCYEQSFGTFASLGCGTDFDDSNATCSYCAIIHGDKSVGAACTGEGFSDCARNLFCADGTCQDLCSQQQVLKAGEVCAKKDGDLTTSVGSCDSGLYCDFTTLNCTPLKGDGEACETFENNCKEGLACSSTDSTCGPPPAEGEACSSICAANLTCDNGVCGPLPGEGAPCTDFNECADGLECDDNDLCNTPEPLVCQVGGSGF